MQDVFSVAIVSIGIVFDPETSDDCKVIAEDEGLSKPTETSIDGAEYYAQYLHTFDRQLIGMNEYISRIASC